MNKKIVFKPIINKRNGQITLHPRKSDLPKELLQNIYDGKEFEMELGEYWNA